MSQNDTQQNSEKLKTKISDEAERKRRENALDEAIENSFPASDPVSAEQPLHAHGFKIPPITFASDCSAADHRHLAASRWQTSSGVRERRSKGDHGNWP